MPAPEVPQAVKDAVESAQTYDPVEAFARELHEAGRAAVAGGLTMREGADRTKFVEWPDCPEHVREGRRVQARWLLERYNLIERNLPIVANAAGTKVFYIIGLSLSNAGGIPVEAPGYVAKVKNPHNPDGPPTAEFSHIPVNGKVFYGTPEEFKHFLVEVVDSSTAMMLSIVPQYPLPSGLYTPEELVQKLLS